MRLEDYEPLLETQDREGVGGESRAEGAVGQRDAGAALLGRHLIDVGGVVLIGAGTAELADLSGGRGGTVAVQCDRRGLGGVAAVDDLQDLPFSGFLNPSLTTVRQPKGAIGEQAVQAAVRLAEAKDFRRLRRLRTVLAPELVPRASTLGP